MRSLDGGDGDVLRRDGGAGCWNLRRDGRLEGAKSARRRVGMVARNGSQRSNDRLEVGRESGRGSGRRRLRGAGRRRLRGGGRRTGRRTRRRGLRRCGREAESGAARHIVWAIQPLSKFAEGEDEDADNSSAGRDDCRGCIRHRSVKCLIAGGRRRETEGEESENVYCAHNCEGGKVRLSGVYKRA